MLYEVITRIDRAAGETMHGWPCFLPDGKHFLYVAYAAANFDRGKIRNNFV